METLISFTLQERKAILVTTVFIIGFILFPKFRAAYHEAPQIQPIPSDTSIQHLKVPDTSVLVLQQEATKTLRATNKKSKPPMKIKHASAEQHIKAEKKEFNKRTYKPRAIICQPFDPNSASLEEMTGFGIPNYVCKNMISYREKGGRFKTGTDLEKIYGMTPAIFSAISECVAIKKRKPRTIAINQATAEDYASLPGIGPVLSARIVKFRQKLGGFYAVDQVAETYGLPPETFDQIKERLVLKRQHTTISVNAASAEILSRHPYISRKTAAVMEQFRAQHGQYTSLADIGRIRMIDADLLSKIAPYLSFEFTALDTFVVSTEMVRL